MSFLSAQSLRKVFPDGTEAVKGIDLSVEEGEFIVLLGPSGCGKTTTLRMIAGLEMPTEGMIAMQGADVTQLRPARRDIGFVFQFYALYPHMTVRSNLAFPLENIGVPRAERQRLVAETAEQMGIQSLLECHPGQISGGDQQRVSLARAMIRKPKLWLMDEPLGTIDADRRLELREWIREKQLQTRVTTLYVTHDQEEAMSLADRVVIMSEGRIEQTGAPMQVYDEPASLFVANFIGSPGMNRIDGEVVRSGDASHFVPANTSARIPLSGTAEPGQAILGIRSEFSRPNPEGPLSGRVMLDEYHGAFRSVHIDIGQEQRFVMRAYDDDEFEEEGTLHFSLDRRHIRLFDPATGRRR